MNLTVFIDKWKIKLEELFAAAVKETSTNRSAAAVFADWLFVGFPLTDDGNSSFPNVWFKGVLHGLGLPSGCNVTASDAKAKPEEIVGLLRFVNEFLEDQQHLTLSSLPVETNPRQFRFLARLVILVRIRVCRDVLAVCFLCQLTHISIQSTGMFGWRYAMVCHDCNDLT